MRTALLLLALAGALAMGGCAGRRDPACERPCWTWQPDCCNSWDWYQPCDLVEGRAARYPQAEVASDCGRAP